MFINNFDPVAIQIFSLEIRWYSLAYIVGILAGWILGKKIFISELDIKEKFDDFITYAILGIIVGGRLGYVLFYNFSYYTDNFFEIFKVWEGGMSFHGGLLGIIIISIWFSKKNKHNPFNYLDIVSIVAPIGIFFGRIANFINGELYGKVTNHKFGMIFPKGGNLPRHPSQLYEAFFEGLILFIILWLLMNMTNFFKMKGLMTGCFIFLYGLFRFFVEFFREPDIHIGYLYLDFSMGQLLSLPMIIIGLCFIIIIYKNNKNLI